MSISILRRNHYIYIISISISFGHPKYLIYINSVGKYRLLEWRDTSFLPIKLGNNWIDQWRGSQIWWESIANQKLMPNMQNFKALRSKFQEKAEVNRIWQLIFGLWKIWYDIIDMTILFNMSMSNINMSTKILYHITYLNLRYNIW